MPLDEADRQWRRPGKARAVDWKRSSRVGSTKTIHICREANLEADVTNSPLCKRGWVIQERFLASKTIHFTEGQLYYESSGKVLAETGSSGGHGPKCEG